MAGRMNPVGLGRAPNAGTPIMNVDSYRQYAADCVRQAQSEPTPEDRNMVLNIALAWLRLAQQTEALQDEMASDVPPDGDPEGDDDAPADRADKDLADEERPLAS